MQPKHLDSGPAALDELTLRRVQQRDPKAMEVFFDHFYDRVFAYAVRMSQDVDLAQDLAQDAFVRLSQALDRLDPRRDPSGWVFTVVANTIRDHWRSREHRTRGQRVSLDEVWNQPPDQKADPHAHLEQLEEEDAIQRALMQLSPADREVLLLRNYQRLDNPTVAEALGISPEAVRQRHSRAVKRLGSIFKSLYPPRDGTS